MMTKTIAPTIDNHHTNVFCVLHEQARAFMAEHGIPYNGDFPETTGNQVEKLKFPKEDGKGIRKAWLKSCYPERQNGTQGLCVTFQIRDGVSERTTRTFWANDEKWDALSEQEKESLRKRKEDQRRISKKKAEDEKRLADELADKALDRFGKADSRPPEKASTYFEKKGLEPLIDKGNVAWECVTDWSNGISEKKWVCLVALRSGGGYIRALQELWPDKTDFRPRDKNYEGKTSGCFYTQGNLENDKPILVAEGIATAITLFKSTNTTTVAAMDSGNLRKVFKELRKRYPRCEITICADNDHHREEEGKGNPGIEAARKVAVEFGCKIAIPEFPAGQWFAGDGENRKAYTDFDDLRQICGLDAVKEQVEAAETPDRTNDEPIVVEAGKIYEAVDAAEHLLNSKNLGIYQRKGQLVRIVIAGSRKRAALKIKKEGKRRGRDPHTLIIIDADTTYLEELLTRAGDWSRMDVRSGALKPIDCPSKVAKMLKARMDWDLPELSGVIKCPTIRRDGSVLQKPGYDEDSGLYFHCDGEDFPAVKDNPTLEDAKEALELLRELFVGFPFDDKSSESVAISATLTALIRHSIDSAPLHGYTAPKMGSGKSLLAEIVSLITTGNRMTAIPQADSEAEERKRLLAVLMEGDPIVCFDNVEEDFGSASLCSVLTQSEFKDRVLGLSKSATAPTTATFLVTGNNLRFVGDISTRVLLCKINPEVERPEEREFDVDLQEFIPKNRGKLAHAALTILKAYDAAGRPKQNIKQFGRFEEWSEWVRSSLIWVGMEDPCSSRLSVEAEDPIRNQLVDVMHSWFNVVDNQGRLIKDILKTIENAGDNPDWQLLKDALLAVAPKERQPGTICNTRLGKYLSKHKGRIENSMKIEKISEQNKQSMWRIVKVQ